MKTPEPLEQSPEPLEQSPEWLERTELLLGCEKLAKLSRAHVLVAGLGGVGSCAAEMICRGGVGRMTIIDGDVVQPGNRNRQLPALVSTEGQRKARLMADRLMDINPELELEVIDEYIRNDRLDEIVARRYDYVVDAIDTLSPKIFFIYGAVTAGNRLVSSMGAGGKTDPLQVQIGEIGDSRNCKLTRIVRKRLHRLGIRDGFKVVYSPEPVPEEAMIEIEDEHHKKSTVGTISYMPPIFGCLCASVVLRDLAEID